MSIRIDYLSNGKKALYCVRNAGVTSSTYETYEKLEDIPKSIRHYAPKGEPRQVGPDAAQFLGFGPDLFPEFENRCSVFGHPLRACVGPGCREVGEGNPDKCPYWREEE